jgi:hypothetical protein
MIIPGCGSRQVSLYFSHVARNTIKAIARQNAARSAESVRIKADGQSAQIDSNKQTNKQTDPNQVNLALFGWAVDFVFVEFSFF